MSHTLRPEWSKKPDSHQGPAFSHHVQTLCPNPQSWDKVSLRMEQKHQTPIKAQHSHVTYKHCAPTHKAGTKCHYEWNKNTRHPSRPSTHMSRTNTVPQPTKLGQSVITNGTKTPDTHQGPALTCHIQTLCPLPQSWDKVSLRMEQKHRTATKALHWHASYTHCATSKKAGTKFIPLLALGWECLESPVPVAHNHQVLPSVVSLGPISICPHACDNGHCSFHSYFHFPPPPSLPAMPHSPLHAPLSSPCPTLPSMPHSPFHAPLSSPLHAPLSPPWPTLPSMPPSPLHAPLSPPCPTLPSIPCHSPLHSMPLSPPCPPLPSMPFSPPCPTPPSIPLSPPCPTLPPLYATPSSMPLSPLSPTLHSPLSPPSPTLLHAPLFHLSPTLHSPLHATLLSTPHSPLHTPLSPPCHSPLHATLPSKPHSPHPTLPSMPHSFSVFSVFWCPF